MQLKMNNNSHCIGWLRRYVFLIEKMARIVFLISNITWIWESLQNFTFFKTSRSNIYLDNDSLKEYVKGKFIIGLQFFSAHAKRWKTDFLISLLLKLVF